MPLPDVTVIFSSLQDAFCSLKFTLPCRKPALVGFYCSIIQGNIWGKVTLAREKQ